MVNVGVPTTSLEVKLNVTTSPTLANELSELLETIPTELKVGTVLSMVTVSVSAPA